MFTPLGLNPLYCSSRYNFNDVNIFDLKFDAGKLVWNHYLCNHYSTSVVRVNILKDMLLLREAKDQCFLTFDEIQTIIQQCVLNRSFIIIIITSELVVAFMDDVVTLGGSKSTVTGDITTIYNIGPSYGLQINTSKCEAIPNTGAVYHELLTGFEQKTTESSTLLGAPLSTGTAMADCLLTCCADLARVVDRLKLISSHNALVLLKNSLRDPKLLHTLRSACCADQMITSS